MGRQRLLTLETTMFIASVLSSVCYLLLFLTGIVKKLEFRYATINSVEFGTFSVLSKLQTLEAIPGVINELRPGSLYFNPGSLKSIKFHTVGEISPGAIAGIPKEVNLDIIRLESSDLSIDIFGGLLFGGSHLKVHAPMTSCACQAAWIVRDNTSMALNERRAADVYCFDFMLPGPAGQGGPPPLFGLSPD